MMYLVFTSHHTHPEQHPLPYFAWTISSTWNSSPYYRQFEILPILSRSSSNTTSPMEPNSPAGFHFASSVPPEHFLFEFSHLSIHALNTHASGAVPCARHCRRLWGYNCEQAQAQVPPSVSSLAGEKLKLKDNKARWLPAGVSTGCYWSRQPPALERTKRCFL